jgi:hypothetical protein
MFFDTALSVDEQYICAESFNFISYAGNRSLPEDDPGGIVEYEILHRVTPL